MAILVNCISLQKTYQSKELFSDLSFSVNEGDRLGVLGPNGSGKSTLVKILMGRLESDAGEVAIRKGTRLAFVAQSTEFDPEQTVYEALRASARSQSVSEMEVDGQVYSTLGKLGFETFEEKVRNLSGGWRKRLEIGTGIVASPDILILDEPTNHLDIAGIVWLEKFLKQARMTWLLVSHDRDFIEKTVNRTMEISKQYPGGVLFTDGSYSAYLENRVHTLETQRKLESSLSNRMRRELDWLSRGPKARTTKAKYRIDAAKDLSENLDSVKARNQSSSTSIEFSSSDRKSKKLVSMVDIEKSMGERCLIKDFEFTLLNKQRIGILGTNGTGKSTFLRLLAQELEPDKGVIDFLTGLEAVYFEQNRDSLDPDWTVKRALSDQGDQVIYRGRPIHVASWGKNFSFNAHDLDKKISVISGGEKAKILIARLMLKAADLLLLDEPTNDLDISTMEVLEESLTEFPGAVVIVSHDRYFLKRICTGFLGLDGRGKITYFADFDQWLDMCIRSTRQIEKQKEQKSKQVKQSQVAGKERKPKKLSYKDQREYDQMEEMIARAEDKLAEKTKAAEDPSIASDAGALETTSNELQNCQDSLDALYSRWAELEEMMSD